MAEKTKNILMLAFIAVCVVLLCIFFISQNSSKTLLYGENGGLVPETKQEETVGEASEKTTENAPQTATNEI